MWQVEESRDLSRTPLLQAQELQRCAANALKCAPLASREPSEHGCEGFDVFGSDGDDVLALERRAVRLDHQLDLAASLPALQEGADDHVGEPRLMCRVQV
ncbi:hypothetical protein WME75_18120 [Sorangium sp. So ce1014]|uniref:hypothetical protein n=1 Tax=Sorangium sp. So ce1014 TaxID=3133326 RepID=UPI003F5D8792